MQDLLFLSQRIPYPPNKGDKIRSFHVVQELCRHYRVHLGCFVDDPDDWQYLPQVRSMVASCRFIPLIRRRATVRSMKALVTKNPLSLPYYYDVRLNKWIDDVFEHRRPTITYLFSSPMAQYLLNREKPGHVVMDFVDVDSQKWADYARTRAWPVSSLFKRESRTLLTFERQVAQFASANLFVSQSERDLFCSLAPESSSTTFAVSNGIDTSYFSPDREYPRAFDAGRPTLVFTGAMDYWPNIEAMRWFATIVLPLLRRSVPDVHLVIVGLNPSAEIMALGKLKGITVTGRVADVRPYLAHAQAVIAPLLTARGVQNKVLEGMAMARPVIATSQALEGIKATPDKHLFVANDASAFVTAIIRAIADPRSIAVGSMARELIRESYSWKPQLIRLRELIGREHLFDVA